MSDPEEENLKTVYYALIDFFEANNPEKVADEDALAVLLDYWIDYGLHALNRLLRRKYNKSIDNVMDPYVGGLIARKERTPKGWPYPSNHPKYKDPLAPLNVDDSIVLPPPKHPAKPTNGEAESSRASAKPRQKQKPKQKKASPSLKPNGQGQQGQRRRDPKQRVASTERQPREKKPREDRGESARRRKREDRGASNRRPSRGGPRAGQRGDQRISAKGQGQPRKGGQSARMQQPVDGQGGKRGPKRDGGGGEAKDVLQRSLHYKDRSRQRQNKQSARMGAQRPKFGQFRSLDDFDSPSDVKLSAQHYVEAFYAAYNRDILVSATGVTALVKWVETHSMEEFNRNLKKKYGSTMEEVGVKRAAVRRKNIENVLADLYEFYDKGKLRKTDLSQMVNKVVFGGVEVLNKEIRQYTKNSPRT